MADDHNSSNHVSHGHGHAHLEDAGHVHEHGHRQGHDHKHGHKPGHAHHHGHAHGSELDHLHSHGDNHAPGHGGHGHAHDMWSGEEYLKRPGVRETATLSYDSIVKSLRGAGVSEGDMAKMDLLEVGCGAGAVTHHLAPTFHTVHGIDTSLSMLLTFSSHLPPSGNVTWSLHAISPSSPSTFASRLPLLSPTPNDEKREMVPPSSGFDVAVANLVIHHVDDLDPFFRGLKGLIRPGGWVVITEFGLEEREDEDVFAEMARGKKDERGSVNSAGHFHAAHTVTSIIAMLEKYGFTQVHAELDGRLPVFPEQAKWPLNLVARGRKPE